MYSSTCCPEVLLWSGTQRSNCLWGGLLQSGIFRPANTRDNQTAKDKHKNIINRSQLHMAPSESRSHTTTSPGYPNTPVEHNSVYCFLWDIYFYNIYSFNSWVWETFPTTHVFLQSSKVLWLRSLISWFTFLFYLDREFYECILYLYQFHIFFYPTNSFCAFLFLVFFLNWIFFHLHLKFYSLSWFSIHKPPIPYPFPPSSIRVFPLPNHPLLPASVLWHPLHWEAGDQPW